MRGSFMPIRLKRPHKRLGGFLAAAGSWLELQEKVRVLSERHRHRPRAGDSLVGVRESQEPRDATDAKGFGTGNRADRGRRVPRAQRVGDLPGCCQPRASARAAPGRRAVPGDGGKARPGHSHWQPGPKTPAMPGQDPESLQKIKIIPTHKQTRGFSLFALWF